MLGLTTAWGRGALSPCLQTTWDTTKTGDGEHEAPWGAPEPDAEEKETGDGEREAPGGTPEPDAQEKEEPGSQLENVRVYIYSSNVSK